MAWQRQPPTNVPLTHTGGDNRIRAVVTLSLTGFEGEVPFLLSGRSDEPALCFQGEGRMSAPGEAAIEVEAAAPLGWMVRKVRNRIAWGLTLYPGTAQQVTIPLGETGPHVVYVTLGRPRNTDEPRSVVTDIRMNLAVERVAAAMKVTGPSVSAPALLHAIMKEQGKHYLPTRHYSRAEAWKVPESWEMKEPGASCISIVEFIGLVCKMIGLEGTVHTTAYYAEPPEPRVARQGGLGDPPITRKGPGKETWQLFLVDEMNSNFGQVGGVGGMNYYEAVLEYRYRGKKYFYPGGTDRVWDTPENVLKVFRSLAWAAWDEQRQDWVVREVVETYIKRGDHAPGSIKLP